MTTTATAGAVTPMHFRCKACEHVELKWHAQCPNCELFATMRVGGVPAEAIGPVDRAGMAHAAYVAAHTLQPRPIQSGIMTPEASAFVSHAPIAPVRITDVQDEDLERTLTGLEPLDRVLGGGLVTASIVLIGGDPGAGKSTLVAQAIAGVGTRVLYATGEETIEQATMRARRVGAVHPEIWIVPSHDVDETIAAARALKPAIVVVDSIQTLACAEVGGAAGSISQIRECTLRLAQYGKQDGVTVIVVGHVTKDGAMAGPNTLKHLVDVVLLLECSELGNRRTLRADGKNRFGSTQEVGVFEMHEDGMVPVLPTLPDHVMQPFRDALARDRALETAKPLEISESTIEPTICNGEHAEPACRNSQCWLRGCENGAHAWTEDQNQCENCGALRDEA